MAEPVHRARGGGARRQADEPGQGALPEGAQDEARPRRVLHRGGRGDRARALRAADSAPTLSGRGDGRDDLPEARPGETAGVGGVGEGDVSLGPSRRRALRHRAGVGDLGGEPRRRRLPSLAVEASRHRASRRAAHRHRPAARNDVPRRKAGRSSRPRGARRDRLHGLAEDLRKPRYPRVLPDRAELGVSGRSPSGARVRA